MKIKVVFFILFSMLLQIAVAGTQNIVFEDYFTCGTLRLDCIREGSAKGDTVWVRRWIDRQAPWHGSHTQLIDPFDNGDYRVVMRDAATGREIYSRGYSNLFREYKDTPEGRTKSMRFEETLLLPMPRVKVTIALQKRNSEMKLQDQTLMSINPKWGKLMTLKDGPASVPYEVHGNPSEKLDVAFVMQGFDQMDVEEYQRVCDRMVGVLFGKEPFVSHRNDFNVYFVQGDAGVEYNTFGADRYAMTFKLWQLHDVLGQTPCDHIIIVVNNETYGGGAIYNFYSVSSLHSMAEFVVEVDVACGNACADTG